MKWVQLVQVLPRNSGYAEGRQGEVLRGAVQYIWDISGIFSKVLRIGTPWLTHPGKVLSIHSVLSLSHLFSLKYSEKICLMGYIWCVYFEYEFLLVLYISCHYSIYLQSFVSTKILSCEGNQWSRDHSEIHQGVYFQHKLNYSNEKFIWILRPEPNGWHFANNILNTVHCVLKIKLKVCLDVQLAVSHCQHIGAETKWMPLRRRHFQEHFLEWKCMNFD